MAAFRFRRSSPRSRPTRRWPRKKELEMPLGPGRAGRGVIGAPVAKAAVVTHAVASPGPAPLAKAAVVTHAVATPGPAPIAKAAVVGKAVSGPAPVAKAAVVGSAVS